MQKSWFLGHFLGKVTFPTPEYRSKVSRQATKKIFSSQHFRQKNQGFRALLLNLTGLLSLLFAPFLSLSGHADTNKNPDKTALLVTSQGSARIHYPLSWEELNKSDGVLLMLRATGADYPSLNVIEVPGKLEASRDLRSSLGERLLQEYRAVGILDARLDDIQPSAVDEHIAYAADLSYSWKERRVASRVVFIGLPDSHLIFTYIYESTESIKDITPLLHILESFHLELGKAPFERSEIKHSPFLVPSLCALLLVAAGVLAYRRCRKRRSDSH